MKRILKRFLKSILHHFGFGLVRLRSPYPEDWELVWSLSAYHASILTLLANRSKIRVVVVGANDGKLNDPLFDLIQRIGPRRSQVILVEPQVHLHSYINDNFSFHDDVHVVAGAIGPRGLLQLHAVRPEYWCLSQPDYAVGWPEYRAPTGVTSTNRAQVVGWFKKWAKGSVDPEAAVETIDVPSRTLSEALDEFGLGPEVDVLQVDAEGFDDVVLFHADLGRTCPTVIRFEASHLSHERLSRLVSYLGSAGYSASVSGADIIAIRTTQAVRDSSKE